MTLVDTKVLLDIYKADPLWMTWSLRQLRSAQAGSLVINMVVYAELAGPLAEPAHLDKFLDTLGIKMSELARPAALLAGWLGKPFASTGCKAAPKEVSCPIFLWAHRHKPVAVRF